MEGKLNPHHDHGKVVESYGKARCSCGAVVSTYTPPQPITGVRLCNQCWCLPDGYVITGAGNVAKGRARVRELVD